MITITKQAITPTLHLVLTWPSVDHAVGYAVSVQLSGSETVEAATTSSLWRSPEPLQNASWYFYQVTALDGAGDPLDASAITPVYVSAQTGTAPLLRQAVYDVLKFSSQLSGTTVVDDGLYQPRSWGRATAPNSPYPVVEVGCPSLQSTGNHSSSLKLATWQVPITIRTADSAGDPDNYTEAWLLAETVEAAIDLSRLAVPGVLSQDWLWGANLQEKADRSKTTQINMTLTVPVRKAYGVILTPDYPTPPEQPETPRAL